MSFADEVSDVQQPRTVAARELRNQTAAVIRLVEAGEDVVLTSRGRPVATISPIEQKKPKFLTRAQLLHLPQTDPGLRQELDEMGDPDLDYLQEIQ